MWAKLAVSVVVFLFVRTAWSGIWALNTVIAKLRGKFFFFLLCFNNVVVSAAAVVEDELVVGDIPKWADAFVLLFRLFYVLHLDYPKSLVNTFIQKLLMGLEDGKQLKPCLLRLKNNLLLPE